MTMVDDGLENTGRQNWGIRASGRQWTPVKHRRERGAINRRRTPSLEKGSGIIVEGERAVGTSTVGGSPADEKHKGREELSKCVDMQQSTPFHSYRRAPQQLLCIEHSRHSAHRTLAGCHSYAFVVQEEDQCR